MSQIEKIYFVHEGKAAYPEIAAYKTFFKDRFAVQEIEPDKVGLCSDLDRSICWYIMGFYCKRPASALVIHDYRSLSIGRFGFIKDILKRKFNVEPDIRIFQNEDMRKALWFGKDIPTAILPMGVPSFIADYRKQKKKVLQSDFCYIGVMSVERRSHLMFDSFLRRFGDKRTFHLYGTPEPALEERYKDCSNILFHGRKSQEEVFDALMGTQVAVNYFPNHNPHKLQTPTKFLEYAALGLRVLCNEQPQSRCVAQTYGLNCLWGSAEDMFAAVPEDLLWPDNQSFDPTPLLWPEVIKTSGIASMIEEGICK